MLANAWLNTLHQPTLTTAQYAQLGTGVFRTDVETAFTLAAVPEPAALGLLTVTAGLLGRRRRGGRA